MTHCALCNSYFTPREEPPEIDYTTYCVKHHDRVLTAIPKDEATDVYEALKDVTLYSTFLRMLTK